MPEVSHPGGSLRNGLFCTTSQSSQASNCERWVNTRRSITKAKAGSLRRSGPHRCPRPGKRSPWKSHPHISQCPMFIGYFVEKPKKNGGRERIRTSARVAPRSDFESGALNHSATLPLLGNQVMIFLSQVPDRGKPIPNFPNCLNRNLSLVSIYAGVGNQTMPMRSRPDLPSSEPRSFPTLPSGSPNVTAKPTPWSNLREHTPACEPANKLATKINNNKSFSKEPAF